MTIIYGFKIQFDNMYTFAENEADAKIKVGVRILFPGPDPINLIAFVLIGSIGPTFPATKPK